MRPPRKPARSHTGGSRPTGRGRWPEPGGRPTSGRGSPIPCQGPDPGPDRVDLTIEDSSEGGIGGATITTMKGHGHWQPPRAGCEEGGGARSGWGGSGSRHRRPRRPAQLLELAARPWRHPGWGGGSAGRGEGMRRSCSWEPRRRHPCARTGFRVRHSVGGEVENEVGRGGGVRRRVPTRVALADDTSGVACSIELVFHSLP